MNHTCLSKISRVAVIGKAGICAKEWPLALHARPDTREQGVLAAGLCCSSTPLLQFAAIHSRIPVIYAVVNHWVFIGFR